MQAAIEALNVASLENTAPQKAAGPGDGASEFMSLLLMFMQQKHGEHVETKQVNTKESFFNNAQGDKEIEKQEQEVPELIIPNCGSSILFTGCISETANVEKVMTGAAVKKELPGSENLLRQSINTPEVIRNAAWKKGDSSIGIYPVQIEDGELSAKDFECIIGNNGYKNPKSKESNGSIAEAEDLIAKTEPAYIPGLSKTEHGFKAEDEAEVPGDQEVFTKLQENSTRKTTSEIKTTDILADINLEKLPQEKKPGEMETGEKYPMRAELKENSSVLSDNDFNSVPEKIKFQELPTQFSRIISRHLEKREGIGGGKDLIIHLEPKELGKLVVKLTAEEGIISVKIVAESSETRGLLENNLANLRQSLADQGIKYGNVQVDLGTSYFQQGQQQEWRQNRQVFNQYSQNMDDGFSEIITEESGKNILGMRSTVDYRV